MQRRKSSRKKSISAKIKKKYKLALKNSQVEAIKSLLISILTDANAAIDDYSKKDLLKDIKTVENRMSNEGLSFATRTLPALGVGLLDHIEGRRPSYDGFSVCKHGYPKFLKGLFRLVYNDCSDCHSHVMAVKVIYQIADGFKKLKGPYNHEELDKQIKKFVCTDKSLPEQFSIKDPILREARNIITNIFEKVDENVEDYYKPRPGPGATNLPLDLADRFKPNTLFKSIEKVFNPQEWFYSTFAEANWDRSRLTRLYDEIEEVPTSRFKFVPKKVGTARGICIEHNDVQYLQQGIKNFIYPYLENHPITSGQINFASQSFNAKAALSASVDRKLATLDMSEASDRIPRQLVKFLFSKLPNLQQHLLALSTPVITFDQVVQNEDGSYKDYDPLWTKKFAPMGSGLCFPIMALVHFAILKAAFTTIEDDPHCKILVYGDDIVIPSAYVETAYWIMPQFGMKFNQDKSFFRGTFRESCGTHAYMGNVITPRYFKYLPDNDFSPQALLSLISNEQSFHEDGFENVSKQIRTLACQLAGLKMPIVHDSSNLIGWKRSDHNVCRPYLYAKKRRWNEDLQRYEYRVRAFHVEKEGLSTTPMPPPNAVTVLDYRQAQCLKLGTAWNERDAYLRSLLMNAEDHAIYWKNTGKILCRYCWA